MGHAARCPDWGQRLLRKQVQVPSRLTRGWCHARDAPRHHRDASICEHRSYRHKVSPSCVVAALSWRFYLLATAGTRRQAGRRQGEWHMAIGMYRERDRLARTTCRGTWRRDQEPQGAPRPHRCRPSSGRDHRRAARREPRARVWHEMAWSGWTISSGTSAGEGLVVDRGSEIELPPTQDLIEPDLLGSAMRPRCLNWSPSDRSTT